MKDKIFVGSGSPHIRNASCTKRIMLDVIIALCPCFVAGIVFFGARAILIVALAIFSAVASEVVFNLCRKQVFKKAIDIDLTSVVTGFLIGLSLNVAVAWFIPVLASIFAIVIVKMLFGGTGNNIVNPAIAGRCFAFISFLGMTGAGMASGWVTPDGNTVAGATPLTSILSGSLDQLSVSNVDLFLGTNLAGCIGETCKAAILLGFVYLIIRKVVDFKWPLVYIAVVGLFSAILKGFDFAWFLPSILSGGLMFVAVFMATDYVTTPNTKLGNWIYFVTLGLLTAGLRIACKVEVVTFAVLLMNIIVPLLDKWIVPKPFGQPPKVKTPKETASSDANAAKEAKQ